jgi:DNA-binding PadR family transcriptional regulator
MRPTTPWSRHSRRDIPFDAPGPEGRRRHPGRDWAEGPHGRRHFPPGAGFGGPGVPPVPPVPPAPGFDPEFGPGFGPRGPRGERGERGRGHRRGRPGRAGRGDVRTAILKLLAEEPMHGYQLMQAVADRTSGGWRLSPGAVYPTIAQLEDEGLVQVSTEGGRKLVTLTDAGRAHVESLGDVDPFAAFGGDGDRVDLRGAIGELMGAAGQLARVGDPAQLTAAATVLADARRALYLILAGEAGTGEAAPGSENTTAT